MGKETTMSRTYDPKVYVACLASYNAGTLYGEWVDVPDDADELREEIARILRGSPSPNVMVECPDCLGSGPHRAEGCKRCKGTGKVPSAEEWAIHDFEDLPKGMGEHPDLDTLCETARMLREHGEAWECYVDLVGEHCATESGFQDAYAGEWESAEDYARDYIDSTGSLRDMPESLRYYFNYESFAHDLECGGDMSFVERGYNKVFAFHNC